MTIKDALLYTIIVLLVVIIIGLVFLFKPMRSDMPTVAVATSTIATTTQTTASSTVATSSRALSSRVIVKSPNKNQQVDISFDVVGEAPGPWFFEASFPLQVRTPKGTVLGRAVARALGNWMSEGQVPFIATVTFATSSYHGAANLILLRDNPSGLPENDDSITVPIVIK